MGDWGVDNLQVVVVLNCVWGGGGGGVQVDLKKIPLVSVNWHNFVSAHICIHISTLLFNCYFYVFLVLGLSPSTLLSRTII